jgi:hypothetical protein
MVPKNTSLRRKLRRAVVWLLGGAAAFIILAFLIDYGVLRLRVLTGRQPYGSVVVRRYYAVLEKNNKTEFLFDPPQPWTCVNSLFPHAGYPPCWYLSRHPEQRTDL